MILLADHFRREETSRHSEWLRQQRWFIKAKQDHQRREDIADKLEDDILAAATETVMSTQIQIDEFRDRLNSYEAKLDGYEARLDAYDRAVIEALTEKNEILDQLIARREQMLANAFVMEDGRRVFKSQNGQTVIDDAGVIMSSEDIDPDDIPDHLEKAETLISVTQEIDQVQSEIDRLHDVQKELDEARGELSTVRDKIGIARHKLDEEEISVKELDDLDAEILEAMPSGLPALPSSALKYLAGDIPSENSLPTKIIFTENADPRHAENKVFHSVQPGFE